MNIQELIDALQNAITVHHYDPETPVQIDMETESYWNISVDASAICEPRSLAINVEDEALKNDDWREGFYEVRVFANIPVEFTVTVKADDEDDAIKAAQIEVDKMPTKTLLAHDQYEEPAVYESTDWHVLGIEESHGYKNTPEDLKAANRDAWNVDDES